MDVVAIEVFGVPIYADPYIPTDLFWAFRKDSPFWYAEERGPSRYMERFTLPGGVFNREMASICVSSVVKRRGGTPDFCCVHPTHWDELRDDVIKNETQAWATERVEKSAIPNQIRTP